MHSITSFIREFEKLKDQEYFSDNIQDYLDSDSESQESRMHDSAMKVLTVIVGLAIFISLSLPSENKEEKLSKELSNQIEGIVEKRRAFRLFQRLQSKMALPDEERCFLFADRNDYYTLHKALTAATLVLKYYPPLYKNEWSSFLREVSEAKIPVYYFPSDLKEEVLDYKGNLNCSMEMYQMNADLELEVGEFNPKKDSFADLVQTVEEAEGGERKTRLKNLMTSRLGYIETRFWVVREANRKTILGCWFLGKTQSVFSKEEKILYIGHVAKRVFAAQAHILDQLFNHLEKNWKLFSDCSALELEVLKTNPIQQSYLAHHFFYVGNKGEALPIQAVEERLIRKYHDGEYFVMHSQWNQKI